MPSTSMFALALPLEWTEIILAVGIVVIVPLGLAVVALDRVSGIASPHLAQLRQVHALAAAPAVVSFGFDPGIIAGLLTGPWLLFTITLAALGATRVLSRKSAATAGIGIDAGLMFVVVGGGWLTLSRLGLNPMGFDDVIVRLTAVHFHFAGFALPIVAGAIARQPPADRPGRNEWLLPFGTILGVPLTAIGIITGGWLEWVAATIMALVGLAVAARLFTIARLQTDGAARALLTIAGFALSVGMALAITYAWFVWFNIDGLPIDRMARTHGSINAFGFGLVGLFGLLRSNLFGVTSTNDDGTHDAGTEDYGTTLALCWGGLTPKTLHDALALRGATAATKDRVLANGDSRTDIWTRPIDLDRFDAVVAGIHAWAGHDAAGIKREPAYPEIETGTELAMTIPAVGPFVVTATCRIVETIHETADESGHEVDRFGFSYATLHHHIVEGVETFVVIRDGDEAWVEVTAHWRPLALAARIAPPITRFLQGRAIGRFLEGLAGFDETAGSRQVETQRG